MMWLFQEEVVQASTLEPLLLLILPVFGKLPQGVLLPSCIQDGGQVGCFADLSDHNFSPLSGHQGNGS